MTNMTDRSAWSDDQWADYINAPEANPVLAIIERGRRIAEYKAMVHADKQTGFERFCKERLRISKDHAYNLIAIGAWGDNRRHLATILPASIGKLYELTRLSEAEFSEALAAGKIHPEMTRADAEALRGVSKAGAVALPAKVEDAVPAVACAERCGEDLPFEPDEAPTAPTAPSPPPHQPVPARNPVIVPSVPATQAGMTPRSKPTSEGMCNMLFLVLCDLEDVGDVDVSEFRELLSKLKPETLTKLIELLQHLRDKC